MEQHKKVLGIIYIATGALQIIILSLLSAFLSTIFSFARGEASPDEVWVLDLVFNILRILPWIIILCISIPSLIAGVGLLNSQRWALIMAVVLGCLKLFSFPIGTAIGVYSIWVYVESNKAEKEQAR